MRPHERNLSVSVGLGVTQSTSLTILRCDYFIQPMQRLKKRSSEHRLWRAKLEVTNQEAFRVAALAGHLQVRALFSFLRSML